ncbi:MAG: hypothetical protein ACLSDQ_01560 [Adlercreutzia equolifaciens]
MARESLASKRERARAIEERMFDHYGPDKRRWTTAPPSSSPWPWCCRPSAPTPP